MLTALGQSARSPSVYDAKDWLNAGVLEGCVVGFFLARGRWKTPIYSHGSALLGRRPETPLRKQSLTSCNVVPTFLEDWVFGLRELRVSLAYAEVERAHSPKNLWERVKLSRTRRVLWDIFPKR